MMAQADRPSARPGESSLFDNMPAEPGPPWPIVARLVRETLFPNWKTVLIIGAAIVAVAATGGALPFLLQRVADDVFVSKDPSLLLVLPAAILGITALRAASDWGASVAEASLGTKIVADLRLRMFDTIAAADLAWLQRTHSGRFVSAFVNDTAIVDRAGARVLITIVKQGLSVLILVGAMVYMDPTLSAIVLLGVPVVAVHLGRQRRRIRRSVKRSLQESGDLGSMLTQTIQSIRVVKAYGQEANEAKRFRQIVGNLRKYIMRTSRSRAAVGPVSEAMSGVGIAGAILYGGWQGVYGNLSLGHFMGFMAAAMLAFQPLKALVSAQAILSEGLLAAARVFALIDRAPLVAAKPGALPLQVSQGSITFRHVEFGYEPGELILSDFDLHIAPGQKVALVGQSGAGKSTVLNLILRFFDPVRGEVLIDGHDLRNATLASVRGASALLTQDPVLFDDTVAANISYGSPGAAAEEIAAAAEAAAAHDFIMRLPNGYETQVGEAGNRLSGGERQRIAFARAMLRNTPILLLDEPTSALDAESEAKVQLAMERLLQGRTVVMIAHRLSTVQKADLICVMENGRIIESGTHAELVARRGKYSRMFQTQFISDEPRRAVAGI
jgi:subfamily B ATP-binding cassette protein MsbA